MKKLQYSEKDKQINNDFYSYFIRHQQDDGWGDKDKYGNFQLLCEIEKFTKKSLSGSSLLDVGSGTGDFAPFLHDKGVKEYLGIDLYHMHTELAKMKYSEFHFVTGDFLEYDFSRTFDFVFSSGAVAAFMDTDNYQIVEAFAEKMWSLATTGVAFNFLTREYPQEKDQELFLYDLEEVLRILNKVIPKARIEYQQNRAGDEDEFLQTHVYLLK